MTVPLLKPLNNFVCYVEPQQVQTATAAISKPTSEPSTSKDKSNPKEKVKGNS